MKNATGHVEETKFDRALFADNIMKLIELLYICSNALLIRPKNQVTFILFSVQLFLKLICKN